MREEQPTGPPDFMAGIVHAVDARIATLLDAEEARWAGLDPDLAEPLAALRTLVLAGGKRLRPAFCHWAFVGRDGDPADRRVVDAGAALEMLHICALIHDDVIDRSDRRHGVDTVHVSFARRHAAAGWWGGAPAFGEGVAILVGDLALVYADLLLGNVSPAAAEVFNQMRLEVNMGQYLDLLGSARHDASAARAKRICRYKSAKYTVERPLHLGAALADPEHLDQVTGPLSAYGLPLGEAFQLTDDLLGVFGEPPVTGKPVGEDLREGKPTLLYALARDAATGDDARLLDHRFGAGDLTPDEVEAMQGIFERTGAHAEVTAAIERLVDQALTAAAGLPLTGDARQALVGLGRYVAGRDR